MSTNTDTLQNLFEKKNELDWTEGNAKAFSNLKASITKLQCLARYNAKNDDIITTDASTKGLSATLWQRPKDGNLKLNGFTS